MSEQPQLPPQGSAEALQSPNTDPFIQSLDIVMKMQGDARFQQDCLDRGVDPFDEANPMYWQTFADFTSARCSQLREKGADTVVVDTLELIGGTPNYLHNQQRLSELRKIGYQNLPREQKREWNEAKKVASTFNAEIRNYALKNHSVQANDMSEGLQKILPFSIEPGPVRTEAKTQIEQAMRGAQLEIAFGQILSFTGLNVREATVEEDIKEFIDFVVDDGLPTRIGIDVKASLSEIEAQGGGNNAYARKPGNKLVMYSLVKDSELQGGFFLSEELARQKAAAVSVLLAEAQQVA